MGSPGSHPNVWEIVADMGDHCYEVVAHVSSRFTGTLEKIDESAIEANANLIAAAPELLAFARKIASECVECGGSSEKIRGTSPAPEDEYAEACPECADIWTVIDKAECPI